jgi:alpha-galactosidase
MLLGSSFGFFAAICSMLVMAALPVQAADTVSLASLDLSGVEQGWGTPHKDQSVDGHPLRIAGRKFAHGLGTHSPGTFVVSLNGATRFQAWVGIDDEVGKRGSAAFEVIVGGKTLWSSGVMHGGDPAKQVDMNVTGMKTLLLIVGDGGDGFEFDHADWADAHFEFSGVSPTGLKVAPGRDPIVAPPVVPAKPKITSPMVVGAQAGTPFLFTIAALGKRPFKFSADKLPGNLILDADTGRITGMLSQPGVYRVTLRAKNADGSVRHPLRIEANGTIALTPPLGWNSYDSYGDDVTEAEVLANARYLKEHLQPVGYEYVVVDYRWYDPGASSAVNNPNARAGVQLSADAFGRLTPPANRFPSAADGKGFQSLADTIHGMGLKFGIHIMRGIPRQAVKANLPIEGSAFHAAEAANTASTCGWCPDMYGVDTSKPAGQAWYDSILRQYAAWGVDFIKIDDVSAPYSAGEVEAMRKAIEKCGRAIVLSLSPGDTPLNVADHVQKQANMWRISGDFWDDWKALNHQFDLIAAWNGHGIPGHWPDADMVPLGHLSIHNRSVGKDRQSGFTKNEQITLMTLWALAPSPFMLGMHLPDNDPFTEALLENEEVVAINQDAPAHQAHRVARPGSATCTEVWSKELADGSHAVGLFNRLGIELPISVKWSELGITGAQPVRDLWQRKDLGPSDYYEVNLDPHGAVLLKVGTGK